MHPQLFSWNLGGTVFSVSSYGFFLLLALIWGIGMGFYQLKTTLKRSAVQIGIVLCGSVAGGLVGARLLHIILNRDYYQGHLDRMINLHPIGLSIFGGLGGALLLGGFFVVLFKFPLWRLADAMVPSFAGFVILARIGCFMNGCCYGHVTNLPWGFSFAPGTVAFNYQLSLAAHKGKGLFAWFNLPALHPTQLYELLAVLLMSLVYWWVLQRQKQSGDAFLIFFMGYILFRFLNHPLRVLPPTYQATPLFYPVLYTVLLGLLVTCCFIRHLEPIKKLLAKF